jgi:hypothetical protein
MVNCIGALVMAWLYKIQIKKKREGNSDIIKEALKFH